MTSDRNGLTVDVVSQRMSEAERLLAEARTRVQGLTENAELASRSSVAISDAAESIRLAATQLTDTVVALQAAAAATNEAVDAATAFLGATDLSAMSEQIGALDEQVRALSEAAEARDSRDAEFQASLLAQVDRSRQLEAERDALRDRLQSVMNQIPQRVAKKIT